jgi:hypothetical protein
MDDIIQENLVQGDPNPIQNGNPYFMGDHALVKFSGGEEGFGPDTYWLVDKSNHTIRPFESHMALDAAFGQDLEEALNNVVIIAQPQVNQSGDITDGVLTDFSILGPEYAIGEDGSSKELDFSNQDLKGRYGKPIDDKNENLAIQALDGLLSHLDKRQSETGIPPTFIKKLKNNQRLMAFYISALAYGDYALKDIYSDITKRFKESNQ